MKTQILLFLFAFISFASFSQHHEHYGYYPEYDRPTFNWGDRVYQKNLEGIGFLMNDLKVLDPTLHTLLIDEYSSLRQREQNAKMIGIGGGVIGGAMLIGGVLTSDSSRPDRPTSFNSNFNSNPTGPEINWALIGGGIIVAAVASIASGKQRVKQQDLLNFTNQFNQYSKGDKIDFSFQPVIGFGENASAGVAFQIKF